MAIKAHTAAKPWHRSPARSYCAAAPRVGKHQHSLGGNKYRKSPESAPPPLPHSSSLILFPSLLLCRLPSSIVFLFSSAMTAFPETQQTGVIPIASHPREDDPPAYTYHPLSSRGPTPPGTPDLTGKTILVPPPTPPRTISPALVSPLSNTRVPLSATPTTIPALSGAELRTLDSRDPLSTCDARFADLILTHVIIPRLRVGVLRWKDRESLEYVPQTKEDVRPSERILCYSHFFCCRA